MKNKIVDIYLMPNGTSMVFDIGGEQMSDIQQSWFSVFIQFLITKGLSLSELKKVKFHMPNGKQCKLIELEDGEFNWRFV